MVLSTLTTVRYASRVIVSTPLASAIAVLALSLAVAGTLSVYSVIEAFVYRRLAVDEPDRLAEISLVDRDGRPRGLSVPMFRELVARQDVFDHVVGWFEDLVVNVEAGGQLHLANVWPVTDSYFAVLNQQPALGRLFDPSGAALNADASLDAVVIADSFWAERFGRDPKVLGRQIRIEGHPFTIVGVTKAGFNGLSLGVDVIMPLAASAPVFKALGQDPHILTDPLWRGLGAGGRLADGITRGDACARLEAWWPRMMTEVVPADADSALRQSLLESRLACTSLAHGTNRAARAGAVRPFHLVLGLTAVLVVIGALQVATLMLQQVAKREHDLAVRCALGARRWVLARDMLMTGAIIGTASVVAGTMMASWGSRFIVRGIADRGFLPLVIDLRLQWSTIALAGGLALFVTIVCSAASCAFVLRRDPMRAMRAATPRAAPTLRWPAKVLIASQIAGAMALTVAAATLHQTVTAWRSDAEGFRRDGLLVSRLLPQPAGYAGIDNAAYYTRLIAEVEAVAGVASAGLSNHEPGATYLYDTRVSVADGEQGRAASAGFVVVSPGLLETLGLQVREGRAFHWSDDARGEQVAIVGARLAQVLFPGGDALGRYVNLRDDNPASRRRIVGIAADARVFDVRRPPPLIVYTPWLQMSGDYLHWAGQLTVRYRGVAQEVTREVHQRVLTLGREYLIWTKPASEVTEWAMANERLAGALSTFYSGVATLLMTIGIFGAISFAVLQRTREIGIRIALGARRSNIVPLVGRQMLVVGMAGIGGGAVLAVAIDRVLRTQVVGLAPLSVPAAMLAASLVCLACAAATLLPAWSAARVDPVKAMRHSG